jgi:hypothetical protein
VKPFFNLVYGEVIVAAKNEPYTKLSWFMQFEQGRSIKKYTFFYAEKGIFFKVIRYYFLIQPISPTGMFFASSINHYRKEQK